MNEVFDSATWTEEAKCNARAPAEYNRLQSAVAAVAIDGGMPVISGYGNVQAAISVAKPETLRRVTTAGAGCSLE